MNEGRSVRPGKTSIEAESKVVELLLGSIPQRKGEMKPFACNFFNFTFQFVIALLVFLIAQLCGLIKKGIQLIFLGKQPL